MRWLEYILYKTFLAFLKELIKNQTFTFLTQFWTKSFISSVGPQRHADVSAESFCLQLPCSLLSAPLHLLSSFIRLHELHISGHWCLLSSVSSSCCCSSFPLDSMYMEGEVPEQSLLLWLLASVGLVCSGPGRPLRVFVMFLWMYCSVDSVCVNSEFIFVIPLQMLAAFWFKWWSYY